MAKSCYIHPWFLLMRVIGNLNWAIPSPDHRSEDKSYVTDEVFKVHTYKKRTLEPLSIRCTESQQTLPITQQLVRSGCSLQANRN